jgi:hypothetical protein
MRSRQKGLMQTAQPVQNFEQLLTGESRNQHGILGNSKGS